MTMYPKEKGKMIDIHSHVLPDMDDGARDTAESYKLLDLLKAQGITEVVLTPHFYPEHERLERFIKRRKQAYEKIKEYPMEFKLASETFLTEALFSNESIEPLCVEDTSYLLLELPFDKVWGFNVFQMIERVIGQYGVQPIVAHIERYDAIRDWRNRKKNLGKLRDMGCLLQVNIGSIVDKRTRRASLKLVKKGWADFAGSDCHNLTTRSPQYDLYREIVIKKLGFHDLYRMESKARQLL